MIMTKIPVKDYFLSKKLKFIRDKNSKSAASCQKNFLNNLVANFAKLIPRILWNNEKLNNFSKIIFKCLNPHTYKFANLASFKYDFSLKSGFVRKWISDTKGNPHKKMFEIAHCRDFPPRMEESSCSAQSRKDCVRIPFIIRYFKKSLSFK